MREIEYEGYKILVITELAKDPHHREGRYDLSIRITKDGEVVTRETRFVDANSGNAEGFVLDYGIKLARRWIDTGKWA